MSQWVKTLRYGVTLFMLETLILIAINALRDKPILSIK